ncbi:hypothetical protein quinque_002744 [Culex quinquefasciatus]
MRLGVFGMHTNKFIVETPAWVFTRWLICYHRLIGSRNLTNSCRVRHFTAKELVKPEAKDWCNLVKVICTQPFNSRVQYGVAFVMLHLVGGKKKDKPLVPAAFQKQIQEKVQKKEPPKMLQLGMFKLREEFPGSVEGSSAGLFARWKASRSGADSQLVAS